MKVRSVWIKYLNISRLASLMPLRFNVGSKNPNKVVAVMEILGAYKPFRNAEILAVEVDSGISHQPVSLEETTRGALNRAKNAFAPPSRACDLSFGLEDGLMAVPKINTGYMGVCVCAIYDGKRFAMGLSPGFEYPLEVTRLVIEEGLDINQAFVRTGLTNNPELGYDMGAIGILTGGRMNRKEYSKPAVMMALIQLEKPELYLLDETSRFRDIYGNGGHRVF